MPEDTPDTTEGASRSFWSGTITFGLVSVPVTLQPAVRSTRLPLRMLDKDGTPLARRYYCPEENREVPGEEIIRGYEIEKDTYIPVTDEELESLAPEKSRDIDLRLFVDAAELDPIYFDRSYFLLPGGQSSKAYRLLAESMEKTRRAGIATFVMRDKEYLVAILAEGGILRAETLRFHDEVRSPQDVDLPEKQDADPDAVRRFEKTIESLTEKQLDPTVLRSRYNAELAALAEKKYSQRQDVVESPVGAEQTTGSALNLMAELQRSLEKHRAERQEGRQAKARPDREKPRKGAGDAASKGTKEDLYERARQLDIPGRSKMNRKQLEKAIRERK